LKITDNSAFNPFNPRTVTYSRDAANVALRFLWRCHLSACVHVPWEQFEDNFDNFEPNSYTAL